MKTGFALLTAAVLLTASCSHKIAEPVHALVTLDPSNSYIAGEPVRFTIQGNPDYILFYSGEEGAQYSLRNRYSVPLAQVKFASLRIDCSHEWGVKGGLDIYVSGSFNGLNGYDGEADRKSVQLMEASGMQGWTKLNYEDSSDQKGTAVMDIDLSDYLENFALAIHWHPVNNGTSAQRTYKIKGSVELEIEGMPSSTSFLTGLDPVVVTMNEELEPYYKNAGNGSVNFDGEDLVVCRGVAAGALNYALDSWIFTTPTALNKVANDKGVAIKDLQNYITGYDYLYTAPGNYTATFVCINHNYMGSSKIEQHIDLSIIEKW